MSFQYDANGNLVDGTTTLGRKQQTIQTHSSVSVATLTQASGSWIDCSGFDKLGFTMKNDAALSSIFKIDWSNDGVNLQGQWNDATNAQQYKSGETPIAARYGRVTIYNGDTSTHIISAWVYLKV